MLEAATRVEMGIDGEYGSVYNSSTILVTPPAAELRAEREGDGTRT